MKGIKFLIVSDTHFNHANIVKYCHRPPNHEELLWKGLKEACVPGSVLIHLGDICMGKDVEVHSRLSELPCKKILMLGNHDKKTVTWYNEHGWYFVAEYACIDYFGKKVVFSHRPIPVDEGVVNVHGHLHNLKRDIKKSYPDEFLGQRDRHILYSPEDNGYKPVELSRLLKSVRV